MNLNKIMLIGRVTKNPELRTTQGGLNIATFGLATNYVYKSKSGEKVENVSFHNCTIFGRGAEAFSKYVVKGQEVYVSGRVEYQKWEKKEGGTGERTVIMVDDFQFGQRPKGYVGPTDPGDAGAPQGEVEPEGGEVKVEDIEF